MAIYVNTAVIGDNWENLRGVYSVYVYVYTKIGGNCIENGNIFPEDGAVQEEFGGSVALSGSTALFRYPLEREVNCGAAYVVDICVP